MHHHSWPVFRTLSIAHDKHPPAPPLLPDTRQPQSAHLSIRSTKLRRILSWIPLPLFVDPVTLWPSLLEISTIRLVQKQLVILFCIKREIDSGVVATSPFYPVNIVSSSLLSFGDLESQACHEPRSIIRKTGILLTWTEDPGTKPSLSRCVLSHTIHVQITAFRRSKHSRSALRDHELTSVGLLLAAAHSVLPGRFTNTSTQPDGIDKYTAIEPSSQLSRSRGSQRAKRAPITSLRQWVIYPASATLRTTSPRRRILRIPPKPAQHT
jgi:hypothetical protein